MGTRPGAPENDVGRVSVRFFAGYREVVGGRDIQWDVATGETVQSLWDGLVRQHPGLARWTPSAAVNDEWADATTRLSPGDEVVFMPPVSGG